MQIIVHEAESAVAAHKLIIYVPKRELAAPGRYDRVILLGTIAAKLEPSSQIEYRQASSWQLHHLVNVNRISFIK